ncbi:MAG: type II toxin-antitoxin system VapC family toxin [Candidatus Thermoplasmatota archaeon]
MKYIDSNVLIYATLDEGERGEWCRDLLGKIEEGEEKGGSSYLTYDEIFWKIDNSSSKEDAIEATETILTMPNLRFFEVDDEIIWKAHQLISEKGVDPRDAIHASTAIIHGIYTMVSEDDDFDDLEEIDREWLDA